MNTHDHSAVPDKFVKLPVLAHRAAAALPRVKGDPLGETRALLGIQRAIGTTPGVLPAARGLSHFGEHALGWFAISGAGFLTEKQSSKKPEWLAMGVSAFTAHAISVILKRVVRRPRPHARGVQIGVATPSKLSFPSSHATSSTAALVSLAYLKKTPLPLAGVPVMAASRLVLGVHYPTDVAVGSLIGLATAEVVRRGGVEKKKKNERANEEQR